MKKNKAMIYSSSDLSFKDCAACSLGIKEFAECLAANAKICSFSRPFGFGFLCFHPDRSKIIESTNKNKCYNRDEK